MSPINSTDPNFSFTPGYPPITTDGQYPPSPPTPTPGPPIELGPLSALVANGRAKASTRSGARISRARKAIGSLSST